VKQKGSYGSLFLLPENSGKDIERVIKSHLFVLKQGKNNPRISFEHVRKGIFLFYPPAKKKQFCTSKEK